MKIVAGGRHGGLLHGLLLGGLVVLLILAVTGWFVARSDGFRTLAAERLAFQTGLTIELEDSYIGWPYVLVLRGVKAAAGGPVSFQVRELRLGRHLRRWTLQVRGARVWFDEQLPQNAPLGLSPNIVRLASLREAGAMEVMRATAPWQAHWKLDVADLDLLWLDATGATAGAVRQLSFRMEPVPLPSGTMYYYRLAYPGTASGAFGSITNLEWEWLSRGGDHYVELVREGTLPSTVFSE